MEAAVPLVATSTQKSWVSYSLDSGRAGGRWTHLGWSWVGFVRDRVGLAWIISTPVVELTIVSTLMSILVKKNFNGIDTDLCEEDIKELQTRKLGVLITISILTLLSNMAILLAILSRPGKVRFMGWQSVAKLSQAPALLDQAEFSLILEFTKYVAAAHSGIVVKELGG